MATYYYDYVNGNNANAGTDPALPKKTFGVTVTLVAGDQHLFKRGVTWSGALNEVRLGIVGNTGGSATNRTILGAYGEGEKPIIDGVNNTVAPIWVRHGSYITIQDLQVTGGVRAGIDIKGNSAGENPTHITVRHCVAYENNTTDFPGVDGIMISKAVGAALTAGCIIENCVSRDNRGHGIKARIGASNTTIRNCVAYNNGAGVAAHGIGTAGTRVSVSSFSLVGGTIYSSTLTPASYGESAAITSIDAVWTDNATYGSLVSAGTSGTPAAGEYSVPANNTLYINIGTNPSGATVEASKNPPINTLIQDCVSYATIDSDGAEGHGFGSDDFSLNTTFSRCIAYGNEGYAFTLNKNNGSSLLNCLAYDNEKGVQIYSPSGTITATGNTIDVDPAQLGCLVLSGRANVTAKNNVLIGGTAGLYVGSATVDAYTESHNAYSGYATAPIRFGATTPDPTSAITADPLLTSNYAPTPSSPLLGAGTHLGYTRGINRKQRPNPPAIGAYDVATMRTPE